MLTNYLKQWEENFYLLIVVSVLIQIFHQFFNQNHFYQTLLPVPLLEPSKLKNDIITYRITITYYLHYLHVSCTAHFI